MVAQRMGQAVGVSGGGGARATQPACRRPRVANAHCTTRSGAMAACTHEIPVLCEEAGAACRRDDKQRALWSGALAAGRARDTGGQQRQLRADSTQQLLPARGVRDRAPQRRLLSFLPAVAAHRRRKGAETLACEGMGAVSRSARTPGCALCVCVRVRGAGVRAKRAQTPAQVPCAYATICAIDMHVHMRIYVRYTCMCMQAHARCAPGAPHRTMPTTQSSTQRHVAALHAAAASLGPFDSPEHAARCKAGAMRV